MRRDLIDRAVGVAGANFMNPRGERGCGKKEVSLTEQKAGRAGKRGFSVANDDQWLDRRASFKPGDRVNQDLLAFR